MTLACSGVKGSRLHSGDISASRGLFKDARVYRVLHRGPGDPTISAQIHAPNSGLSLQPGRAIATNSLQRGTRHKCVSRFTVLATRQGDKLDDENDDNEVHTSDGLSTRLGLFYGAFFGVAGIRTPFLPVWLGQACSLSTTQISFILSWTRLGRILTGPLFGLLADLLRAPRTLALVFATGSTLLHALLLQSHSYASTALLLVLASSLYAATLPLVESLALSTLGGQASKYGRVRVWGSVTFLLATAGIGAAQQHLGVGAIMWGIVLGSAAVAAVTLLLPQGKRSPPKAEAGAAAAAAASASPQGRPSLPSGSPWRATLADFWVLVTDRVFALALASAACLQCSHVLYYNFGSIAFQMAGHSGTAVGLLWSVGVAAEILLFMVAPTFPAYRALHPPWLLVLGGAAGVLRWGTMATNPPLPALILLQAVTSSTETRTRWPSLFRTLT